MNLHHTSQTPIYVIIATAFGRTNLLLHRSLSSVYRQKDIDPRCVQIIIVDDNPKNGLAHSSAFTAIQDGIISTRRHFGFDKHEFRTTLLTNQRTPGHSGTGAWNTGIFHVGTLADSSHSFVSLLDDDDEFSEHYLTRVRNRIKPDTAAVFASLIWLTGPDKIVHELKLENITPEAFFIGNPGVQGSNTFVATRHLMAIGGFDETFPSCADRELMIRLLDRLAATTIEVIQDPLVYHHNHKNVRVSLDLTGKHIALDLLYAKYKARFSQQAYFKSIERATRFFGYKGVL